MKLTDPDVVNGLEHIVNGANRAGRRYVDGLFKLSCGPDLLALRLYPNTKELTESAAAYAAVAYGDLGLDRADDSVHVFCVGDGGTPRTGAMFAFRSAWGVTSIDPALKRDGTWPGIARLRCISAKIEDAADLPVPRVAVIVAVHSHAPIPACLEKIKATEARHVIAIPCCVPLEVPGHEPISDEDDFGILSPKRRVRVWKNV